MKCQKCNGYFEEKDIQESHDVPCYLFYDIIGRRLKKQEADGYGRHWLCENCHEEYEKALSVILLLRSTDFSKWFFKEEKRDDSISKIQ